LQHGPEPHGQRNAQNDPRKAAEQNDAQEMDEIDFKYQAALRAQAF